MDEKFKLGDIVRLKSGGPKMTVVIKSRDVQSIHGVVEAVSCGWFYENDGVWRTADFPTKTLIRVKSPEEEGG